jgi:O-acetyl-ADP-ribose deacetylase (regulator of RNase III)
MAIAGGPQLAAQGIQTVVNTVAPRWMDGRQEEDAQLFEAALQALLAAEHAGRSSVTMTAIGSGIFGVPKM